MSEVDDLKAQVERLQAQVSAPDRRPLCEAMGCPRSAIGYVEQDGVRWLACDRHGGVTEQHEALRTDAARMRQAIADYLDDVIDAKELRHAAL